MNFKDRCLQKNIKVIKMPNKGEDLRKQWENSFVGHLNEKEKRSIYLYDADGASGFLWHVFSYETKDFLEGEKAEQAFHQEPKDQCYVFYQHLDDAFILENASSLRAEDLADEEDIYITDKKYNWTFVKTHETGWFGPYFSRKNGTGECSRREENVY